MVSEGAFTNLATMEHTRFWGWARGFYLRRVFSSQWWWLELRITRDSLSSKHGGAWCGTVLGRGHIRVSCCRRLRGRDFASWVLIPGLSNYKPDLTPLSQSPVCKSMLCPWAIGMIMEVHISQTPIKRRHAPHHRESHHTKPVLHPVTLLPSATPHFSNHIISFSVFRPIHTHSTPPPTNWKETKRTTNPAGASHLKRMQEWNHTVNKRKNKGIENTYAKQSWLIRYTPPLPPPQHRALVKG